ncbi:hypothetical protein GCM10022239_18080 [Leifsonia bigeumensis]|uniref:Uncharacterized protein n=1 Tax=Leifsonella bigeumensis TaxID=433643 RepID=A0ABP7FLR3_9MICO
MITLSWLFIITILAAALALFDGISRLSGRRSNSILAIGELLFAALMLLSIFFAFPAPLGTFLFSLLLEIVLVLMLLIRGTGAKGVSVVTVIALILNAVVLLIALGWLTIPGLG